MERSTTFNDCIWRTSNSSWTMEIRPFRAMRNFFEFLNKNIASAVNVTNYMSLAETLYSCKTKLTFKQYHPNKPAKYGLLFKSLNSAQFAYTYQEKCTVANEMRFHHHILYKEFFKCRRTWNNFLRCRE